VANQLALTPVPVGDIQAFYNSNNNFGVGNLDGPAFAFENTTGVDITNGVFRVTPPGGTPDSFRVGTVPAGGRVFVVPGVSDDGGSGHSFFRFKGTPLDTSDEGPNTDDTQFEFTGMQGQAPIDSGVFTPAATRGPTNDRAVPDMNFLGGPGNNDG